jgi:lipopolysaccharide export system permease protein
VTLPGSTTLSRYLALRFLAGIAVVFGTCVGLVLLIDFVEMLRRASDNENATVARIFTFTLLRLPSFTEQLFPFAVLFGSMGAMLRLSQKLELVVVRAAGVSVWQFVAPGLVVALGLGLFATTVYNPLAALAKATADQIEIDLFSRGPQVGTVQRTGSGTWMRQDGIDGPFVMSAAIAHSDGRELRDVAISTFDSAGRFADRISAGSARLRPGYWHLSDVTLTAQDREPEQYASYMIATNLSYDQARETFVNVDTVSFWDLPYYINSSVRAGLSAERFKLHYQSLLAKPFLLMAMVLIAATVSLRLFRLGSVLPMILGGVAAGFLLYVAMEMAKQLGTAGVVQDVVAAWTPVVVAMLTGLTILLHQEDG